MIRAMRTNAMAQDDATMVPGWNISPNVGYLLVIVPDTSSCAVILYKDDGALVASGAALTGTEQPCVLVPQFGQNLGMVDAELGWHLLVTTTGTESQRAIRISPAVDLPDEIHPVYSVENMALARATAVIDEAAHYRDDVTVLCPLGLGAGLGDVVSAPVDGVQVVGQVESIIWTATPDGESEQTVVRQHVAIAPEPYVEPVPIVPPSVADDAGETDAATEAGGNVLANDEPGLAVVAVNGLSSNVGVAVDGNNGGTFTIGSDGLWTFDPDGDFALLTGSETADTSVTYHASDGVAEAMATVTVTVSAAAGTLWTPAEITTALWLDASDTDTITLDGSAVSEWRDKSGNGRHAAQSTLASKPARIANGVQFDGVNDYLGFASAIVQSTTTLMLVIAPKIESAVGFCFGQWASGMNGRLGLAINQNCSGVTQSGVFNPFVSPAIDGGCSNGYPSHFSISSAPTIVGVTVSIPGSENWKSYKNGAMQDSATASHVATGVNSALGSANAGNTSYPYDGIIREVIALHAISDTDRQKIEGYLAHKWDELLGVTTLVDALPSDHPYKTAAPTI